MLRVSKTESKQKREKLTKKRRQNTVQNPIRAQGEPKGPRQIKSKIKQGEAGPKRTELPKDKPTNASPEASKKSSAKRKEAKDSK